MPTPGGQAIMCAYKLCKVEFRYWGMQSKIERFIHDMALRNTMLRAHRQVWKTNSLLAVKDCKLGMGLAGRVVRVDHGGHQGLW